jgi:hypothetical protein
MIFMHLKMAYQRIFWGQYTLPWALETIVFQHRVYESKLRWKKMKWTVIIKTLDLVLTMKFSNLKKWRIMKFSNIEKLKSKNTEFFFIKILPVRI